MNKSSINLIRILFTCLNLLFLVHLGDAQIKKQWTHQLNGSGKSFNANSLHKMGDHVIYVQTDINDSLDVVSMKLIVLHQSDGDEVWSFEWDNIRPRRTEISVLPIDENKLFFLANHRFGQDISFYGVINLFDGIAWQDTIPNNSRPKICLFNDNLLIDLSQYQENNTLRLVDEFGNQKWQFDFGTYGSRHALTSNGLDKAMWLYGNNVALIDATQQLIAIDSSAFYIDAYTHFSMGNKDAYSFNWGIFHFAIRKYENDFQNQKVDTLPYGFDIFGMPNPTVTADAQGNVYLSSDYTYDGRSFLVKYDSNLVKQWTFESDDAIVNLFPKADELIAIDKNSINLLNKATGNMLLSESFAANEEILNRTTKNEFYDPVNEVIYLFTRQDSCQYLHRYDIQYSGIHQVYDSNKLTLFPNPSIGYLFWTTETDFNKCMIYNLAGKLVYSAACENNSIDISQLDAGIFIIELANGNKYTSTTFIKQ